MKPEEGAGRPRWGNVVPRRSQEPGGTVTWALGSLGGGRGLSDHCRLVGLDVRCSGRTRDAATATGLGSPIPAAQPGAQCTGEALVLSRGWHSRATGVSGWGLSEEVSPAGNLEGVLKCSPDRAVFK